MPSILVYGPRFGSSFRVHWALAELGLAYETAPLDMAAGDHQKPEYLALNPSGQVPTLVYDGFILTESAAILHYLAEKRDPALLGPETPESRATLMRWELFVLLNLNPHLTALASKTWNRPSSPETEAKAEQMLSRYLPVLDQWLAAHPYLAGETFTVADIVARSSFLYAEMTKFDLAPYPALQAWIARCSERPAFNKAKQK